METLETERHTLPHQVKSSSNMGFFGRKIVKLNVADMHKKSRLVANLGGEGNDNPLQYSCLENPVDRGAWWAAVHRVARSQTRLKQLSTHACIANLLDPT